MKKWFRHALVAVVLGVSAAGPASAATTWGPLLANNILGGAGAGALVGLSAGMLAYGLDDNYHPQYLLNGMVYGLLGGAVLGSGMAVYEISNRKPDSGYTLTEYLIGGTGIGALLGGAVATIPFLRDGHGADYTIGIGLGGLIGATAGLVTAAFDIESRTGEGDHSLSGRIGIMDVAAALPAVVPGMRPEAIWNCKLAKFTF